MLSVCTQARESHTLVETRTPDFSFQASTWLPNALESDKANGKATGLSAAAADIWHQT